MGSLGTQEMILIFILALLVFGPKKLPELGKTVAKAMGEFRRASSELKSTFEREMNSLERENESLKDVSRQFQQEIAGGYDEPSYYDYGDSTPQTADSTATSSTTVSASAPQGAEQTATTSKAITPGTPSAPAANASATAPVIKVPEGTVAQATPGAPKPAAS